MDATTNRLVEDYLHRLALATAALPAARREELLAEIRQHLADARDRYGDDDAAMRTTLDRLGEPEDIAAAAREDESPPPTGMPAPGTLPPRRGTGLEIAAVVLLTAGSFIPVMGWLAGVVLLWASSLWKWWEKLLGTLVWPLGPAVTIYVGLFASGSDGQSCGGSGPVQVVRPDGSLAPARGGTTTHCTETGSGMPAALGITLLLVLLLGPIVVDCFLLIRARRRAQGRATARSW